MFRLWAGTWWLWRRRRQLESPGRGRVGVGGSFWPAGSQKSSSCVLAAVGLWGSHFSSPSLLFLSLQMEVLISTVGKL